MDNLCEACPRKCKADRNKRPGICHAKADLTIGRAALHFDEEPCISGKNGAGTIFFTGCNLGCCFCQNEYLSKGLIGKTISDERLVEIFYELKNKGAHNIDLVTPSHYTERLIPLLERSPLPVVWNSSAYEKAETLKKLEGRVDVYLPDFKFSLQNISEKYAKASDYPEYAKAAIKEMVRQTGPFEIKDGLLKKGVLIRHLVLPGELENSYGVLDWIAEEFPAKTVLVSLMGQYTPYRKLPYENLNRGLTKPEYIKVRNYMRMKGLVYGYEQSLSSFGKKYTPEFDLTGV